MTGLTMVWISTIVTTATTAVLFVLLAQWSAGGPAPWSIVPGLARGIRDWGHRDEDIEPFRFVSPAAEDPDPRIDITALPLSPLSPLESARHQPDDRVADEHVGDSRGDAAIEELGTRRI